MKQLMVAIDFHGIFFPYYGSQWLPSTDLVTNILKNIFFCVQQKKNSHTFGTTWNNDNNIFGEPFF